MKGQRVGFCITFWECATYVRGCRRFVSGEGGVVGHGRIRIYVTYDDVMCSRSVAFNHTIGAVAGL